MVVPEAPFKRSVPRFLYNQTGVVTRCINGRDYIMQPVSTIFVVDDNRAFIDLITIILRAEGYHVCAFCDATSALSEMLIVQPDLVLVDLSMPRMSGIDFILHMRRCGLATTPVILITAGAYDLDTLPIDGLTGFFVKPLDMADLLPAIRLACEEYHQRGTQVRSATTG